MIDIKDEDCPVFVSADDPLGFISWAIRAWTKGIKNHSMSVRRPGYYATQGWMYKEVPMKLYKNNYLKFWIFPHMTAEERERIFENIDEHLKAPWWKRMYDWLGIVGQATGIRWIHFPFRNYCSEREASQFIRVIFPDCPVRPNPEELDKFLEEKRRTGQAKILGYQIAGG